MVQFGVVTSEKVLLLATLGFGRGAHVDLVKQICAHRALLLLLLLLNVPYDFQICRANCITSISY